MGSCINWRGSPCSCPHRRKVWPWEQGHCKTLTSLPVFLILFFSPVRCNMKQLVFCFFFFPHKILSPCQSGLEKAKAGTNWNPQVSNSHFSFSTWAFALLGFLQSGCYLSWHLQSFLSLSKWKCWALYPMGADLQCHESRTCLGSLWWERQDNLEQNIPWEPFLFNTFQFPGPTASAWSASTWVNDKILTHELPLTSGRLLCSAATHSHDVWSCVYIIPWSTRNVLIHLNSAQEFALVCAAINGRSEIISCWRHRNQFTWGFTSGINNFTKIVTSDTAPRGENAIFWHD